MFLLPSQDAIMAASATLIWEWLLWWEVVVYCEYDLVVARNHIMGVATRLDALGRVQYFVRTDL